MASPSAKHLVERSYIGIGIVQIDHLANIRSGALRTVPALVIGSQGIGHH